VPAISAGSVLERSFYEGDSVKIAPRFLNKLLVRCDPSGRTLISGRIVEVEAYRGPDDPASHAYKGLTRRNAVMFGPAGRMYVYFTYGMHWCANLVCGSEGVPQAVLLRALAPVEGIDLVRAARGASSRVGAGVGVGSRIMPDRDLLSGPARLCQGLGITGADDGADLVDGDRHLVLVDDGIKPPKKPGKSVRIGIRVAADLQWRYWVPGEPNVSRGKPATVGRDTR